MFRRFRYRHDVVDGDLFRIVRAEGALERPERGRFELFLVADDVIHLVHAGELSRIDLGGAAGYDDLRVGTGAPRLANGLARLAHGLTGHRAGVDDHRVAKTGSVGVRAHDFGLVGVETAAKSDELQIGHFAASNRNRTVCQTPWPSGSAAANTPGGSVLRNRGRMGRSSGHGHPPRAIRSPDPRPAGRR